MTQSSTPAPAAVPRNGFGVTALVLAIVGLLFGLVPITGFLALILGVLAVVFGVLGVSRARKGIATNRGMAITSTALGALAIVLGVIGLSITARAVDQLGKDISDIGGENPAAMRDVAVSDCSLSSQFGITSTRATVRITNSTDRTQSYLVTISVNDASGARTGEITVASNSVAAGQSATVDGTGTAPQAPQALRSGAATCAVAKVTRFPS